MQQEINGFEIARALNGPESGALAAALVNCTFYPRRDKDGDGFLINATDADSGSVTVRTSNGSPCTVKVASGAVAPSLEVVAAIDSYRARAKAPYADDMTAILQAGIQITPSREDAAALVRLLRSDGIPDQDDRFSILGILERYRLVDLYHSTVRKWASQIFGPLPSDLAIKLAKIQRDADEIEAALVTLERGLSHDEVFSMQLGILLTQQAAVLLDYYERTGDLDALARAWRSYRAGLEIEPKSSHLAWVRARLDRLS